MPGTVIDYGYGNGFDTLGRGEFGFEDGMLVKYELPLEEDNPNFRRFDRIWSKDKGWVKLKQEEGEG